MEANVQSSGRAMQVRSYELFVSLMPNFVANEVRQSVDAIKSVSPTNQIPHLWGKKVWHQNESATYMRHMSKKV
jgi:hypothetical protein